MVGDILTDNNVEVSSQFAKLLQMMGNIPDEDLQGFLLKCYRLSLGANEIFMKEGDPADFIFFIEKGAVRHFTSDKSGNEHTTHFAFENEFEADYRAFLTRTHSAYTLQALKDTQLIVVSREAYDWLKENVDGGQTLILNVTEMFLIYFATRLRENYVFNPLERYEAMEEKFPGIYDQVPQYMIASYIGVSKVHLSRLKSQSKLLKTQ